MGHKIFVVDDEIDILKVVIFRLKKEGFDVVTASDGQKALELMPRENPALALLDITLPGLNGYEICRKMKADDRLKHIPVVFLTASGATEGFEARAREAGAQGYVFKPFEFDQLRAEIEKFLPSK